MRIEICKRIPIGGGMGGGSADAAAALRLAAELASVDPGLLAALAAELGADVPSQLAPGLVLGTGAGDTVEALGPLAPHALLILPSRLSLSTEDVYGEADRLGLGRASGELAALHERLRAALGEGDRAMPGGGPIALGSGLIPASLFVNDLEPAALALCPSIGDALQAARSAGAEQILVSGSGPTVAGLFWGAEAPRHAAEAASALQSRFPGATSAVPVPPDFGIPRIA